MAALVDEGLAKAGRPKGSVPAEETEVFCKNARKLLVRAEPEAVQLFCCLVLRSVECFFTRFSDLRVICVTAVSVQRRNVVLADVVFFRACA